MFRRRGHPDDPRAWGKPRMKLQAPIPRGAGAAGGEGQAPPQKENVSRGSASLGHSQHKQKGQETHRLVKRNKRRGRKASSPHFFFVPKGPPCQRGTGEPMCGHPATYTIPCRAGVLVYCFLGPHHAFRPATHRHASPTTPTPTAWPLVGGGGRRLGVLALPPSKGAPI